ncbi:hypothetical protein BS47DRAFT_1487768, partial [Hydnum rufescens UP504]
MAVLDRWTLTRLAAAFVIARITREDSNPSPGDASLAAPSRCGLGRHARGPLNSPDHDDQNQQAQAPDDAFPPLMCEAWFEHQQMVAEPVANWSTRRLKACGCGGSSCQGGMHGGGIGACGCAREGKMCTVLCGCGGHLHGDCFSPMA